MAGEPEREAKQTLVTLALGAVVGALVTAAGFSMASPSARSDVAPVDGGPSPAETRPAAERPKAEAAERPKVFEDCSVTQDFITLRMIVPEQGTRTGGGEIRRRVLWEIMCNSGLRPGAWTCTTFARLTADSPGEFNTFQSSTQARVTATQERLDIHIGDVDPNGPNGWFEAARFLVTPLPPNPDGPRVQVRTEYLVSETTSGTVEHACRWTTPVPRPAGR